MVLLEDQHRPQANSLLSRTTNVQTKRLGLLQEPITARRVPRNECSLAFAAQIHHLVGVLGRESLELAVEVRARLGGVADEIETLDFFDDGAEDDAASWVAHPGVELTVGLVGAESGIAVEVTSGLSLLGESDDVGRRGQIPVVVGPELAGGAETGLNFVDDEEDVVALGDVAETLEESGGGVVVTTLGLDGFDDNGGDGVVEGLDDALGFFEAALLFGGVLFNVLLERVLEHWERSLRPVEGRNVELVNRLGAGGGERAEETAVESGLEGHDGELRRAGRLVGHGGDEIGLREVDFGTTTLALAVVHECSLVGSLVGVGAGERGEDLVHALGRSGEHTRLEQLSPIVRREVTERRAVDEGVDHLGRRSGLAEGLIVVTDGDGGDLGIAVPLSDCPFLRRKKRSRR